MVAEQKRYVIGIDGGGTKTHALIVGLDGAVVAECTGGPTNIGSVGITQAAQILYDLIHDCCLKAECAAPALQNVVLGIAGAGRPQARAELAEKLTAIGNKKKFPLRQLVIESDARIALEAAFAGGPGIVLIAGTGSIALYRTEDGKILRSGGWGALLGDEGSGFAIGRDGLNAALRQHDGRGEKTLLTKKALEHFAIAGIEEMVTKVYQDKADIAAFAPKVLDASFERDRIAHLILVKNSTELVEHVRVLTMLTRPHRRLPVSLMGGLLGSENVYQKLVKEKIVGSLPNVVVQQPKFPAAFGAAIIGLNAFR